MGARGLSKALGALVLAFGATIGLAGLTQRKLMFPAPRSGTMPTVEEGRLLRIPDAVLGEVVALHVPAPPGAATWVHFHGNGEELGHLSALGTRVRAAGLGFYAVEYPGFGLAPGDPGEITIYRAAERALEHLETELGTPRATQVLVGQSLGSAVAVEMASRRVGTADARLVLISPFSSMVAMAARFAPILPVDWLVRDRFDSLAKAPTIPHETLIVHGERDALVPLHMAQALGDALPRATVDVVPGAGHNDLFVGRDGAARLERVLDFVRGVVASAHP